MRSALVALVCSLLRLAGLPPLVGFYGKLIVLARLNPILGFGRVSLLLTGSAFFLFIYTRLCLNLLRLNKDETEMISLPRVTCLLPLTGLLILPLLI